MELTIEQTKEIAAISEQCSAIVHACSTAESQYNANPSVALAQSLFKEAFERHFEMLSLSLNRLMAASNKQDTQQIHKLLRPDLLLIAQFCPSYAHILRKPYGYAGDYLAIELCYDGLRSTHIPEVFIFGLSQYAIALRWMKNLKPLQAVIHRKEYMKRLLMDLSKPDGRPRRILSLASGPAREMFEFIDSIGSTAADDYVFVGFDADPKAVEYVEFQKAQYAKRVGTTCPITVIHGNVIRAARNPHDHPLGRFDMIYSAGLIDYFDEKTIILMLNWIYDHLLDVGGRVCVGNFEPHDQEGIWTLGFDWPLHYRTVQELQNILLKSKFSYSGRVERVSHDSIQLFLWAEKGSHATF